MRNRLLSADGIIGVAQVINIGAILACVDRRSSDCVWSIGEGYNLQHGGQNFHAGRILLDAHLNFER